MKLEFKEAKLIKRTQYVGEDATTQTLTVCALFNRPLANALKVHDLFFAENGIARRGFDAIPLTTRIEDAEVTLSPPASSTWLATADHFKVGHPTEKSETDPSLEVQFSLHFACNNALGDWFDDTNKQTFLIVVKPPRTWNAQEELFPKETEPAEATA